MKILLCQSYLGANTHEPLVFPLGLAYISSMIKEKHEVYCWDPNIVQDPMKELCSLLDKIEPEIVGVSLRNIDSLLSFSKISYYSPFVFMIRKIKRHCPSCKLVVGGAGFSLFARDIMTRNPEIDFGVVSEGEFAFAELLENLDHPERVKSIIIRKDGKLLFTGNRELANVDLLPFPSWELFDLEKYRENYSMGIMAKRGCCFKCLYCCEWIFSNGSLQFRSPKKIVDEIESLVDNFGFKNFVFVDALFNFPLDYSRDICKEIIKRKLNIKWHSEFNLKNINFSSMKEAVRAGCKLFSFSPDGASNDSIRFLGKNYGMDSIKKSITLASKIDGVAVSYSFLYDLPRYNAEHMRGLLRLIPEMLLRLRSKLRFISLSKMRIQPGTSLYDIALKDGKIDENTDLLYPVHYESESSMNLDDFLVNLLRGSSSLFETVCKRIGKN